MVTERPSDKPASGIRPARFEDGPARVIAGLREHYTFENRDTIPALWGRFAPHIGTIAGQVGAATYGVIISTQERNGFDYLAGIEVSNSSRLPPELAVLEVPAQLYAIFDHPGSVTTLCETVDAAFHQWLPMSGQEHTGNPDFFERYGEAFDPETGMGGIEIWLPLKSGKETA